MKKGDYVEITKESPCENPEYRTPNEDDYYGGIDNGAVSLPNKYSAKGVLLSDVEVGKPCQILRDSRNGFKIDGYFRTSEVQKITEDGKLVTVNSIYTVQKLVQPKDE